jgi:DNA-binding LacI/PurR family transcriptional regulator
VSMASILDADAASVRAAVELLLRQNVEALVLVAERTSALEAIQSMELGVPLLAVEPIGRAGFHSVSIDHYAGARAAVRHLVELGHTRILHLAGPVDAVDAIARVRGWRDELGEHGLVVTEPMTGDWSPQSGYIFGQRIASRRDFTAVFAANDQMALGLIHGLSDGGLVVPRDVSVIGFDDVPEAAHFSPPLTTMRQDFSALGREIMEGLLDIVHDEDAPDRAPATPERVIRSSTSAPSK